MVEHHLVTGGDFAPAGEVLSKTLLLFFGHLLCSPLHLLLHCAETPHLAHPALHRVSAVPVSFAFIGSKKSELDGGRCLFEPVKPVMIHLREDEKEKTSQPDRGRGGDADTSEGDHAFSSNFSNEGLQSEPRSDGHHEDTEGGYHSGPGGKIPGGRGNKTQNA